VARRSSGGRGRDETIRYPYSRDRAFAGERRRPSPHQASIKGSSPRRSAGARPCRYVEAGL